MFSKLRTTVTHKTFRKCATPLRLVFLYELYTRRNEAFSGRANASQVFLWDVRLKVKKKGYQERRQECGNASIEDSIWPNSGQ